MEALPVVPPHSLEEFGARSPHPERARGSLGGAGDTRGVSPRGMGLFSLPWLPSRALQLPWERRIGVKKRHLEMAKKRPGFAPFYPRAGAGPGGVVARGCPVGSAGLGGCWGHWGVP